MSRRRSAANGADSMPLGRQRVILAVWLLSCIGLLAKAVDIQVLEVAKWREAAANQQRVERSIPAARGSVLDRDGSALVLSEETFRIGVAPHELLDRDAAAVELERVLGLASSEATRIVRSDRRWVMVPGSFPPSAREELGSIRGVHLERELRRFYPQQGLAQGLLGVVLDGVGAGGIEQEFEDHLRGVPGSELIARDSGGRPIPGESWLMRAPEPGGSVTLTLDAELQEIANEALRNAVEATSAAGGDLIVTEPDTGEILAMVSIRGDEPAHVGGINTPYEPGSTLKPFTVAALLREKRASLADSVDTGNGTWTVAGRQISDVSVVGRVSLERALQTSSNVGIAKVASRLSSDEQYEALRDFGFGLPTGILLPGESSGRLRRPAEWSAQSAASLAIGYEISVTPLQMAMAYGALANGGVLMEPRLVREIRDADGRVVERFDPEPVRRVVSEDIAAEIGGALVGAVETGTGRQAHLASFAVAGKSGTSRATGADGRYEVGAYFASFVGFFPAEAPQLVVLVKLDRPRGAYYGGTTAAPVTRATMEAVLAARESPLDREALAAVARAQRLTGVEAPIAAPAGVLFASRPERAAPSAAIAPVSADGDIVLPDLRGTSPRTAARQLHGLGLHVVWGSAGPVSGTIPSRGSAVVPGDTVRLLSSLQGLDAGRGVGR